MTPQERASLVKEISEALSIKYTGTKLTDEEVSYVRLAIQREAQSIKLRQAVIEKTFTGLVWAFILFSGTVLLEYIKSHGWK
jgi:hypothetical protein